MPQLTKPGSVRTNWQEHPAIIAWREMGEDHIMPDKLELLQGESLSRAVYRFVRATTSGLDIIAKRCSQSTVKVERFIYEEVLPNLPLPMLPYYGSVEEPGGDFYWLFLRDVSGDKYDNGKKQHRIAAARWLGVMNVSAVDIEAARQLPEKMPNHYLQLLNRVRDVIRSSIANPTINEEHLASLNNVFSQIEYLSGQWNEITSICEMMPQTLVHGDLIGKNVAVQDGGDGLIILPFDWEKAGWGSPAEDISRVDIESYWLAVREAWGHHDFVAFSRLAKVGKIFRCLVFLDWLSPGLEGESIEETMFDVRRCERWLADLIHETGWKE